MTDFISTDKVYMAGAGEAIPDAKVLNGKRVVFKMHEGGLKEIDEASGAEVLRYVGAYEDGAARLCTVNTKETTTYTANTLLFIKNKQQLILF